MATRDVIDPWAAWLLERRHGGNRRALDTILGHLAPIRDRVLENAVVQPGNTVLDVGCGDGLIGFGALERVGPDGRVVFSDVSRELLDTCAAIAAGDLRCEFVRADVTDLSPIANDSIDAATLRSVLIYVADRQCAFAELFRVLRPGGRLSIFEPLNSFEYPGPENRWGRWDVTPVRELADRVKAVYREIHDRAGNTMHDFVATDFVELAEGAGFVEVHAEARYELRPAKLQSWDEYESLAANPLVPTLRDAIDSVLSPEDAGRLRGHLRTQGEAGEGIERSAFLYLWARK